MAVPMPFCEKWWDKAKCWWADWFQWQSPDPEILTHLFFCCVISSSLCYLVVFSHLLFLLFFLAKVKWHIRLWSHPAYLAVLCTHSPMACVPSYPSILCLQLEHWWHHSQQPHEFKLLPWVGVKEGMVQNGRIISKNMFYMLFYSFLYLVRCVWWRNQACLGKTVWTPWRMG